MHSRILNNGGSLTLIKYSDMLEGCCVTSCIKHGIIQTMPLTDLVNGVDVVPFHHRRTRSAINRGKQLAKARRRHVIPQVALRCIAAVGCCLCIKVVDVAQHRRSSSSLKQTMYSSTAFTAIQLNSGFISKRSIGPILYPE